jgi:membrane protein implicated in regulation of membrane protease activity
MLPVIDFFVGLGAWNWFIVAVALYLLETIIPGVHFMWFGAAATVMGAVTLAYPMPIALQLVAFAIISLLTILWSRRMWRPGEIESDEPNLNERGHSYVGRMVTVEVPIVGGRGKVRVGDTIWTAAGPDLPAGTRVKVTGVDGTVLQVASPEA